MGGGGWKQEKNASTQHFLLFPYNVFYPSHNNSNFLVTFTLSSTNTFNLDRKVRKQCRKNEPMLGTGFFTLTVLKKMYRSYCSPVTAHGGSCVYNFDML